MLILLLACTSGENITAADLANTDSGWTSPDDLDGDGYSPADGDCDDDNADVNPGKAEVCDDVDNDCDDEIDEDATDATSLYADVDGDEWGNVADVVRSCSGAIDGRVDVSGDCDDNDPDVNPAAQEICDDLDTDEDCDGFSDSDDESVDESTAGTWYEDADGDGYGNADSSIVSCDPLSGYVDDDTDCNDDSKWETPENECDVGWMGTYTGPFEYTATAFGITDTCSGSGSIDIDETASPAVYGSFSCTWATLGTAETVTWEGTFTSETEMEGDLTVGSTTTEGWTGTLSDPDDFSSTFSGTGEIFGQAVPYEGSFEAVR